MHRGDFGAAIDMLQTSAAVARAQHAVIELGRTLAVLAQAARTQGDEVLLAQADAGRAALVEKIGPEVRGLSWAWEVPSTQRQARA